MEMKTNVRQMAKCGLHSLGYCRRYGSSICGSCKLVKRKPKLQVIEDGVEKKLCPHCGKVLPLHRFYDRIIHNGDKVYRSKTSWCRMCMSAAVMERARKKLRKKII